MEAPANPALTLGSKLVELCRKGQNLQAIDTLYSKDIVSVESCAMPGFEQTQTGIDKIRGKNQWWLENHTVHGGKTEGPFPHGSDRFAVYMEYDVTPKVGPMAGQRNVFKEVAVYTVKGDRIVKEEFFYAMG